MSTTGWFILIYFVPALIAILINHKKVAAICILNLLLGWTIIGWVVALVWTAAGPLGGGSESESDNEPRPGTERPEIPQLDNKIVESARILERTLAKCQQQFDDATTLISRVAAADGKISRAEIRTLFNFCQRNGGNLDENWQDALQHINQGLSMSPAAPEAVDGALQQLENRPIIYITRLAGALASLTSSSSKRNKVAERIIESVEQIMLSKTNNTDQSTDAAPEQQTLSESPVPEQTIAVQSKNIAEKQASPEPPPEPVKPPAQPSAWVDRAKREIEIERSSRKK